MLLVSLEERDVKQGDKCHWCVFVLVDCVCVLEGGGLGVKRYRQ